MVVVAGVVIFGRRPILSLFPAHWRYLSATKQQAMLRAVEAAGEIHHTRVSSAGCWIVQKHPGKCFVFLDAALAR
jgi:hypothetical protein